MILLVAPYDGSRPELTEFLAGSKKIREILKALILIDPNVVLLNSAHTSAANLSSNCYRVDIDGDVFIDVFTPQTYKNKFLGRLLNLLHLKSIISELISIYGLPHIIWLYNGYAFEMRLARIFWKSFKVKSILEFEDWHFARNRGLNPKPFLDWIFWIYGVKNLHFGFAVNSRLRNKLVKFGIQTSLLPGIVNKNFHQLLNAKPPFKTNVIVVGYFGGLSIEKGADVLLRLPYNTSDNIRFIVTGKGPLHSKFCAIANLFPERFIYLGPVTEESLVSAISQADVIINAHKVNDGVFPFKVIESLSTGRLLISTCLPMDGYEYLSPAIQFYDGDEGNLAALINNSFEIYKTKYMEIEKTSKLVYEKFGFHSLVNKIRSITK